MIPSAGTSNGQSNLPTADPSNIPTAVPSSHPPSMHPSLSPSTVFGPSSNMYIARQKTHLRTVQCDTATRMCVLSSASGTRQVQMYAAMWAVRSCWLVLSRSLNWLGIPLFSTNEPQKDKRVPKRTVQYSTGWLLLRSSLLHWTDT
jgi:hypothetical protein